MIPQHGTESRYVNHRCRCLRCTEAHRVFTAEARARRTAQGLAPNDQRHGKASTYQNYGCRCGACTAASSAARKSARQVRS